ncbi:GAP family protein [Streptomyces hirsutus]
MGEVLGDVPGLAAGGAASPLPIGAVIIVPATPRGRVNGLVFVTGWVVGLSVLGAVMPAIGGKGSAGAHGQPADRVGAFKLALGVALVSFRGEVVASSPCRCHAGTAAAMDGRDRPLHTGEDLPSRPLAVGREPEERPADHCRSSVHQLVGTARGSVDRRAGDLRPRRFPRAADSTGGFLVMGERAKNMLGNWKEWAARHNTAVMAVLFFVFGLKLLGDGIDVLRGRSAGADRRLELVT